MDSQSPEIFQGLMSTQSLLSQEPRDLMSFHKTILEQEKSRLRSGKFYLQSRCFPWRNFASTGVSRTGSASPLFAD
jgi:hypothetical protein